jgi:copper chaperone
MLNTISVENLKCGGCATTITHSLGSLPGVSAVAVDVEQGQVSFEADDAARAAALVKLNQLGYPEAGSAHGLAAAAASAKSYVSCAIGKVSNATS